MKDLKELMESKGISYSYQRCIILKNITGRKDHPTADRIYNDILKQIPGISKTTIYNTLNTFAENNIINELTITADEARYDPDTLTHHHFLCKKCGKIIDIDIPCPHIKKKAIEGNKIEEIHGYFKGICKKCL
ncbi:MAG: transcriptional repressor [Armatimonadota bacterium]